MGGTQGGEQPRWALSASEINVIGIRSGALTPSRMQLGAWSARLLGGHLECGMPRGQSDADVKGLAQTLGQAVNAEDTGILLPGSAGEGAEVPEDSRCTHRGLPEPMWAGEGGALRSAQRVNSRTPPLAFGATGAHWS